MPRHLLMVEDNPLFARQLTDALTQVGVTGQITQCTTGAQALDLLDSPKTRLDMAFVDLGLPDVSGLEVISAMHRRFPEAPILVISVISSERALLSAIRAGARGYILKGAHHETLVNAIEEVMRGHYPISPSMARCLFRLAGAPMPNETSLKLSPRELETLRLIARGHSYEEVGTLMGVALSTVQSNIRNLYRKLDAHSQIQAVTKAREIGLI